MSVFTTVVFTDLFGSTGVFESLGNARAAQVVTQTNGWIAGVIEQHGGRVVKMLGDGVLATFVQSPDAIGAVVDIQRQNQRRLMQLPESQRMPVRVGVASGEVEIVDGDCYGDAVNVAARLSDLSGAHQIWAASAVLEQLPEPDGVQYRPLGPITIRGRAEPCAVSQVEWREETSTDFLTIHADLDTAPEADKGDALGAQLELRWLDKLRAFRAFDMPVHIGRMRQSQFMVNDPRVSRTHARIDWRNGSMVLVDLSSYGTWVRFAGAGSDLLLRREECVLHGNGEIALGSSFADLSAPTVNFVVG